MPEFRITLPHEKEGTYRLLILLTSGMNVLALFLYWRYTGSGFGGISYLVLSSLAITLLAFLRYFFSTGKAGPLAGQLALSTLPGACAWILLGVPAAGMLMGLLSLLGRRSVAPLILQVDEEGLIYPSFPRKRIAWSEVQRVLLRDGVLTIDLRNNRLMQFVLPAQDVVGIEEEAFNTFVRLRCPDE